MLGNEQSYTFWAAMAARPALIFLIGRSTVYGAEAEGTLKVQLVSMKIEGQFTVR